MTASNEELLALAERVASSSESCSYPGRYNVGFVSGNERDLIVAALRLAAQSGGEVVAWQWYFNGDWQTVDKHDVADPEAYARAMSGTVRPIYTSPTSAPASVAAMKEALMSTVAHLAAAISLLERTTESKKAAPSNKMFDVMLSDYRKALVVGRDAIAAIDKIDVAASAPSEGNAALGCRPTAQQWN